MKSIALYYNKKRIGGSLLNSEDSDVDHQGQEMEHYSSQSSEGVSSSDKLKEGNEGDIKDTCNDENSLPQKCELHINLWKVEKGRMCLNPVIYIDFGIMFPIEYQTLCLFLPFEIDGDPMDLSEILRTNDKTLGAVFNADVQVNSKVNDNFCKISFIDDPNRKFYLYKLGETNFKKESFKNSPKGVFVKITINSRPEEFHGVDDLIYVRLRVKLKDPKDYIKSEHISNDLLQAAFSMTDLFDIRVNENRVLDSKVKETMKLQSFEIFKFDKVHLFYMVDTREIVNNGSSLKQDTRILEEDQWDKYRPKTSLHGTTFVAYHWKKRRKYNDDDKKFTERPIDSFSVFFNTVYPRIQGFRLFAYFLFAVLIGWLGSMLSFRVSDIKFENYYNLAKPTIVLFAILVVVYFVLRTNIGLKCLKIFRKR